MELSAQETDSGSAKWSEAQIEAYILQEEFKQDRYFAKLRRDMIYKNKKFKDYAKEKNSVFG